MEKRGLAGTAASTHTRLIYPASEEPEISGDRSTCPTCSLASKYPAARPTTRLTLTPQSTRVVYVCAACSGWRWTIAASI